MTEEQRNSAIALTEKNIESKLKELKVLFKELHKLGDEHSKQAMFAFIGYGKSDSDSIKGSTWAVGCPVDLYGSIIEMKNKIMKEDPDAFMYNLMMKMMKTKGK